MENIGIAEFYDWLKTTDYAGAISLTAKFYVKPGYQDSFKDSMKSNVMFSRTESGMIWYKMYADYKDPQVFWLVEEWASVEDLMNHVTSKTYVANEPALLEAVERDTQIAVYKTLDW